MFKLESKYKPMGDQPKAIDDIVNNLKNGNRKQVLLGATGTGKTFTMCNVIAQMNKPTLILAHNKTLAGQLYSEIKEFFPNNHVGYFISYYDYFQPESYVVSSDTFIEKDSKINEEIDEMRHAATAALIDYKDVIIVSSVSCIYGIGDIDSYKESMLCLRVGESYDRKKLLYRLVEMQYQRNEIDFSRGTFRMRGEVLEIISAYESKKGIRIEFFDDEIERIRYFDIVTGKAIESVAYVNLFAATHFVANKEKLQIALKRIKEELDEQVHKFESEGKLVEAQRIKQRTSYDLEMLQEVGTCSGVENYSRHLTLRNEGEMPATLIDFFGDDFLFIIDESHVTLPQVRGMFNGDRSRKETLVNFGFRLPSALDNRPLRFNEFEDKLKDVVFVSATPGDYELDLKIPIVQQIIRPTGLLDPIIEVRQTLGQVDDIYSEILKRIEKDERVLITTLTIKMSEDLTNYLKSLGLNVAYLHSEIKSLERMVILRDLRLGKYDVLIGINLLREGLDLPEVSLVCILDADKQGFLRSNRSLIQTIGRAARNASGKVIMYADKISDAMQIAIEETTRRRQIQEEYNLKNNITPTTIRKDIKDNITVKVEELDDINVKKKLTKEEKIELINKLEEEMKEYAKNLNFEMAAQTRDAIMELKGKKN